MSFGLSACATTWPDEPGASVPATYAENARAADTFRAALVAARAGTMLPEPTVTPSLQARIREIGTALQHGDASAERARATAQRWGQTAFGRAVEAWVLDCAAGPRMRLPGGLTSPPVLAIAYTASHFRPRSFATVQCAIVVVSARGASSGNRPPARAPQSP